MYSFLFNMVFKPCISVETTESVAGSSQKNVKEIKVIVDIQMYLSIHFTFKLHLINTVM